MSVVPGTIVTADVLRRSTNGKQVLQHEDNVSGLEGVGDFNRQAFPRVFVSKACSATIRFILAFSFRNS
jgi:hypothetical protein